MFYWHDRRDLPQGNLERCFTDSLSGVSEAPFSALNLGLHVGDGEELAAVISPQDGTTLDPAELRAWLEERLAAYKCPRAVRFLDALPRTPNGKVQRKRLAAGS